MTLLPKRGDIYVADLGQGVGSEQVRTISIYRLKKYLGTLNEKDIRKIDKALKISLEVHKHEVK